ncbi:MAG: hypothetical protein OEL52_02875 [Nitrosopumilus sp.]|nr:hypothetical protein [Nitrosopumilus sp.]
MSQTIVSDKIYKRGKDIEEYLSSRYSEPWVSKARRSEIDEGHEISFCPYCDQQLERPYWESRYNGIRGRCLTCEVVWNLS